MLKSFWVIKKKKSWEMWRKALSNYSVYLGSSWWNIYITAMEVLKVIKLAGCVSSLFPRFSGPFQEKKRPKRGGSHFSSPSNCIAVEPQRATSASVVSSSLNATFKLFEPERVRVWDWLCFICMHDFPSAILVWSKSVKWMHSGGGT